MSNDTQTAQIHSWQSIVTLIVFLVTNLVVVFPFKVPIPLPQGTRPAFRRFLVKLRILPKDPIRENPYLDDEDQPSPPTQLYFPFNFVTMPPISVIFLTCLKVISREEYHDGIIGSNNIIPIDIMAFFLTLAYVAISIDATGLIRSLAFWVAKTYGGLGHRLYFLLYLFFFGLGSFIGNDPIILSGTAFMAYLTRVSANIKHPRAWIYAQFAVANISSAILVSSNPTNLVLSGAFRLRFLDYTINMIIPVIVTAAVLFPFLLYIIFFSVDLIPYHIDVHSLIDNDDANTALSEAEREHRKELREIMNPLIDRGGAIFGGALMAITLTTLLATNAAGLHPGVYTMTVPAAAIMFTRDLWYDWGRRGKTREMAREKREKKIEKLKARAQSAGEERVRKQTAERAMTAGASLQPMPHPAGATAPTVETPGAAGKPRRDTLTVPARDDHARHHHYASHGRSPSLDEDMMEEMLSAPVDVHPLEATTSWESSMHLPEDVDDPPQSAPMFERDMSRRRPDAEEGLPGGQASSPFHPTHHRTITDDSIPASEASSSSNLPQITASPEEMRRGRTLSGASGYSIGGHGQNMGLFSALAPPTRPDVDAADRPAPVPASAHRPSPLSGHHRRGSSADLAGHGRRSSEGDIIMQSPASSVFETSDDDTSIGGDRQSESSLERHAPLANGHSEENANGDAEKVEDAELANGHVLTKDAPSSHLNGLFSGRFTRQQKGKGPESPIDSEKPATPIEKSKKKRPWTLYKLWRAIRKYAKETFPTVSAVLEHLPFALVPFAFSMFILVQALVTKGWVNVFANGWHAWITKTGTVGGIGGMGFVSVLLCNFAGTNIGTSILLSRVLQFWLNNPNNLISDRDRDASIYALALGVNYGAFSAAFNASLAGLLWRDILARKHIHVQRLEFARINLPIIAIAMSVGCAVLTGQVYLIKDDTPRHQSTY